MSVKPINKRICYIKLAESAKRSLHEALGGLLIDDKTLHYIKKTVSNLVISRTDYRNMDKIPKIT